VGLHVEGPGVPFVGVELGDSLWVVRHSSLTCDPGSEEGGLTSNPLNSRSLGVEREE